MNHKSARAIRGLRWLTSRFSSAVRVKLLRAAYPGLKTTGCVTIGSGADIHVGRGGVLEIHSCRLGKGVTVTVAGGARMVIEADYIGQYCTIVARHSIRIGQGTKIAENTVIRDADHDHSFPLRDMRFKSSPVEVGEDVWISAGCTILKGLKIGDGSTVGAGSVVTKSVSASSVVAGVPAREIHGNRG